VSNQGMIGVDVGGTFTDNVSIEDGKINALKVRTNYTNMEASVLEGAEGLGVESKSVFNHASTAGLNAIITRKLPKVAYLTTYVHRDVLDMARLWRPFEALTDANWRRSFGDASRPLVPRYLRRGIKERITHDGSVLMPLDEEQAREELELSEKSVIVLSLIAEGHSYSQIVDGNADISNLDIFDTAKEALLLNDSQFSYDARMAKI
jgi:N-methylhydantoinase A